GGRSHFGQAWSIDLALVGAGIVTALPLLWFAAGARRMRLSTIGLFQYLEPTLQLLLGVLLYGEAFTRTHFIAFTCIWIALAIYSWNGWVLMQRRLAVERKTVPAQVSGAG
ncbi:MAG: EamA family transporter, partial [Acidobacteria bacterium]|nr:EamA family transporter [Acidobacteriota bacterium]